MTIINENLDNPQPKKLTYKEVWSIVLSDPEKHTQEQSTINLLVNQRPHFSPDDLEFSCVVIDGKLTFKSTDESPAIHSTNPLEPTAIYFKDGIIHRDGDLPAQIIANNDMITVEETYLTDGVIHRDGDKPAYIQKHIALNAPVHIEYYKHGVRHRDNGPADITFRFGEHSINANPMHLRYFQHGKLGNLKDEPSYIFFNPDDTIKFIEYYKDGEIHRENGPATTQFNTTSGINDGIEALNKERLELAQNGPKYNPYGFPDFEKLLELGFERINYIADGKPIYNEKLPSSIEIIDPFSRTFSLKFKKENKLHRDGDKPALIEFKNQQVSSESYYVDGVMHRDGDNPAYTKLTGGKVSVDKYYRNGKLHREGGEFAISETKGFIIMGEFVPNDETENIEIVNGKLKSVERCSYSHGTVLYSTREKQQVTYKP